MSLTKVSYSMIDGAVVNVLDYGAVGDGVTDDTAAIKLALIAGAGKAVYFPSGTYIIFNPSNSSEVWLPISSNTEIFGDGATSVIKIKDGWVQAPALAYSTPFWLGGVSNVSIHDLKIDGNKNNTTGNPESPSLIYVNNGSENIKIYNNRLVEPNGDCVTIGSLGAVNLGGQKVQVYNNICYNPGRSCIVMTSARDVTVTGNLLYNAVNSYVDIETDVVGTFVSNVTISNNVMRSESGVLGTAFACTGPGVQSDIVFSSNVCKSTTGISLGGPDNSGIIVTGNYFDGKYETGTRYFVEVLNGLSNSVISNNVFQLQGTATGGMWVRGPSNVLIEGNTLRFAYYETGIKVDDPYGVVNPSVSIQNNNLDNCYVRGILVDGSSNPIRTNISGNSLFLLGASTQGILANVLSQATISNNTISAVSTTTGIRVTASSNCNVSGNQIVEGNFGIDVNLSQNTNVSGNTIVGAIQGVYVQNSSDYTKIALNNISLCAQNGVVLASSSYTTLDNNTILNNSQSSANTYFGVSNNTSNITIVNNTISDNQGSKTQKAGIRGTAGNNYYIVSGNDLAGNATSAVDTFSAVNYWPNVSGTFATDLASFNRTV